LEDYLTNFKGCVIIVSHDRYFMDKVADHLLVFHGQGDIQHFPGNYTDYHHWKEDQRQEEPKTDKPQEKALRTRTAATGKRKPSFKELREFEQLEKEIEQLEAEKKTIEQALCSGSLSVGELTEHSRRLPQLNDQIDEKTLRWMELSGIME
jgi:ATP-binding cassette subfamily F protein uup